MVGHNMDGPSRDRVMKLIEEKDRIESEISNEKAVLAANNVGMREPLIDEQGFPRSDIDVYKVRYARHKIICLRNDYDNIMKEIEKGLTEIHSQFLPPADSASTSRACNSRNGDAATNGEPDEDESSTEQACFAVVGFVQTGSPAALAGLCEHDMILELGSMNARNFTDITQVHDIVTHSAGQPLQVKVKRDRHILNFTVVPRPWARPGLLGCQIMRRSSLPDT